MKNLFYPRMNATSYSLHEEKKKLKIGANLFYFLILFRKRKPHTKYTPLALDKEI